MVESRTLIFLAALTLLTAVGAGAFGAHALKRILAPEMISIWQTAVLYQLIHGLGMLVLAALATRLNTSLLNWAGTFMFAGVILFSGSLYALTLSGPKWLGPITPIGGVAFVVAWTLVALAAYRGA